MLIQAVKSQLFYIQLKLYKLYFMLTGFKFHVSKLEVQDSFDIGSPVSSHITEFADGNSATIMVYKRNYYKARLRRRRMEFKAYPTYMVNIKFKDTSDSKHKEISQYRIFFDLHYDFLRDGDLIARILAEAFVDYILHENSNKNV